VVAVAHTSDSNGEMHTVKAENGEEQVSDGEVSIKQSNSTSITESPKKKGRKGKNTNELEPVKLGEEDDYVEEEDASETRVKLQGLAQVVINGLGGSMEDEVAVKEQPKAKKTRKAKAEKTKKKNKASPRSKAKVTPGDEDIADTDREPGQTELQDGEQIEEQPAVNVEEVNKSAVLPNAASKKGKAAKKINKASRMLAELDILPDPENFEDGAHDETVDNIAARSAKIKKPKKSYNTRTSSASTNNPEDEDTSEEPKVLYDTVTVNQLLTPEATRLRFNQVSQEDNHAVAAQSIPVADLLEAQSDMSPRKRKSKKSAQAELPSEEPKQKRTKHTKGKAAVRPTNGSLPAMFRSHSQSSRHSDHGSQLEEAENERSRSGSGLSISDFARELYAQPGHHGIPDGSTKYAPASSLPLATVIPAPSNHSLMDLDVDFGESAARVNTQSQLSTLPKLSETTTKSSAKKRKRGSKAEELSERIVEDEDDPVDEGYVDDGDKLEDRTEMTISGWRTVNKQKPKPKHRLPVDIEPDTESDKPKRKKPRKSTALVTSLSMTTPSDIREPDNPFASTTKPKSDKKKTLKTPHPYTNQQRDTPILKGKFIQAELEELSNAVETYKEVHDKTQFEVNALIHMDGQSAEVKGLWNDICSALPDRPRQPVIKICRRKFHNFKARGAWTAEQDEELKVAYEQFPKSWKQIGATINRLPEDCRDRWRNYLVCGDNLRKDYWTEDEEKSLRVAVIECMDAIQELKRVESLRLPNAILSSDEDLIDWQVVSQKMYRTRSRLQCMNKWKKLKEREDAENEGSYASAPISESRRLDEADSIYDKMKTGDKYQLLCAIRDSHADREGKIPWANLGDEEYRSKWKRMPVKVCLRKLMQGIEGYEDMKLQDIVERLIQSIDESDANHIKDFYEPPSTSRSKTWRRSPRSSADAKKIKKVQSNEMVSPEDDEDDEPGKKRKLQNRMRLPDESQEIVDGDDASTDVNAEITNAFGLTQEETEDYDTTNGYQSDSEDNEMDVDNPEMTQSQHHDTESVDLDADQTVTNGFKDDNESVDFDTPQRQRELPESTPVRLGSPFSYRVNGVELLSNGHGEAGPGNSTQDDSSDGDDMSDIPARRPTFTTVEGRGRVGSVDLDA
jgi:hypothetical protein